MNGAIIHKVPGIGNTNFQWAGRKGLCYNPASLNAPVSLTLDQKIRRFQRRVLDGIVSRNPSLGLDQRAEFFSAIFEKFLPPQSRIVDIGGGWGFYGEPLERRGHSHTVLEVIKPGYSRAPVVIYDPSQPMPFPDKSFDVSLFVTVLHHIPDPQAVLKEAKRITRGRILVVEDLYNHALGRIWTVLRDQIYNCEFFGHPCQFKKKDEWLRVFESLGLAALHTEEVETKLAGLKILNGVFVLDASR